MMDVKGGAEARAICFFAAAVKCNVAGSGTVVAPKPNPNPTAPAEPRR